MSLLGVDVGTTGCKAAAFSLGGEILASAYEEYDIQRPQPGQAELDAGKVWMAVKRTIRQVTGHTTADPLIGLAVSSMGEAVVPVTQDRKILGPSILNFDLRGEEYLPDLRALLEPERLYRINGNTLGNHYSLTKLMWIKQHQTDLYRRADWLLHWSSFVTFMLGAEARLDYSLANRTLLIDLERGDWSEELLEIAGLDREKLPDTLPSGSVVGRVSATVAAELGLPSGVAIVSGAHDQCANALGCGVIHEGQAVFGMGTFICITPVFQERRPAQAMLGLGLNTEHHAVPGQFVCFIYNMGGAIVKWYRDTFAGQEQRQASETGRDVYFDLFGEMAPGPSPIMVLPHFIAVGPPTNLSQSNGAILGLSLETRRADILKAILEANVFSLKQVVDQMPESGLTITEYRAAGGGSKSEAGMQICADILGRPFIRPANTEAGALGAALLAGVATGLFPSYEVAVREMVHLERTFEPDMEQHRLYQERFQAYRQLGSITLPRP